MATAQSFASAKTRSQAKITRANGAAHHTHKATARTESVGDSESIHAGIHAAANEFAENYDQASSKRRLLAWTAWALSFGCTASAATHLLSYAVIGAVLLSGSSFIATMIWIVGTVLTIYAALIAGNQAMAYVVSSRPEHHWQMVKSGVSKIAGFFKRSDDEVPA
jgi:hypothetical protein